MEMNDDVNPLQSKETKANGENEVIGLKAKMSLLNGCTVIVGSIIGSGELLVFYRQI